MLFYNFISYFLVWIWNELAQEVEALAVEEGITGGTASEELSAPTEGVNVQVNPGANGLALDAPL